MGRFFQFSIIFLLVVVVASSCCEKKIYCSSDYLDFAFTGFVRNEVRSFTLRKYAKGDQYGKVLDSSQFIYYGSAPISVKPDTLPFQDYRTVGNLRGVTSDNDWSIYLPATGKLYYITTVFDDGNKSQLVRCGDDEAHCIKAITNFSINNDWQTGGFIYMAKGRW